MESRVLLLQGWKRFEMYHDERSAKAPARTSPLIITSQLVSEQRLDEDIIFYMYISLK